jgi:flavin reductase (DIM6/NTAB) family NADH-FMN oxidoreductase RutF
MKKNLGPVNCMYPLPTVLVGADVDGKPNYLPIAHVGIATPKTITLGINKIHYTNRGITENKSFSINIPSEEMVRETDYCGLVSGKEKDKGSLFTNFYGKLKTAPMIEECPLNMECRLINTVDMGTHDLFIGEVVETYCEEKILAKGVVDYSKVKPFLFDMNSRGYWKLGTRFADAWSIGKKYKK